MSNSSVMSLKVAKFGGTSVADFDAMNCSADIVLSNPMVRLVVLSASNGVTNMLLALSKSNTTDLRTYYLDKIRCIQYSIVDHLAQRMLIRKTIDQMIANIAILSETTYLATSLELTDELISYGELMSTILFVEVLRQRGVQATWFDVRNIMRTNDHFGCAEPDSNMLKKQARALLLPRLKRELVITQGFIGSEPKRRTTTLGRGSSDYTAVLLGEALEAKSIDIWTDVPGIYTADPHIIPHAKRIDKISFEEAAEMANFGAKILHPATLIPAARSAIPIFIGSSKEPGAGGTLVCNYTNDLPIFRALTLRRCQALLTLRGLNVVYTRDFLEKVFNILLKNAISVDFINITQISLTLVINAINYINNNNGLAIQMLISELSSLYQVKIKKDLALVTLIGNELLGAYNIRAKILDVLKPLNAHLIYYGSGGHSICLLVSGDHAEQILKTLHNSFFND